jgi:hypothetical protein
MTSPYDNGSGKSMPEQMLDTAEQMVASSGMGAMISASGGDVGSFTAMVATIGIILTDIEDSTCVCTVCDTLRELEKRVRG